MSDVLYDVPGPKAVLRNRILTAVLTLALAGAGYLVWKRLSDRGQWAGELWEPFTHADVWTNLILPGLVNTLKAAAVASVLALVFGAVFGVARLSEHRWIRIPAAVVVELFRAVPLLILIVFLKFGVNGLNIGLRVESFTAVVVGLMLYNGSVLAEIFRAGVSAVPRGQSEAAYGIGLRKTGVMVHVMLPQAVTAMMPAIVAQLVVLLKDTALGFIVAYEDLLYRGVNVFAVNPPVKYIQAMIVIAIIYITINMAIGFLANRLEARSRRSRKSAAAPVTSAPAAPGMSAS
ncbi:amino acid ABC transporter permease [Actinocorallia longicatena]|uniref:Amino acid ABC transporter permease n=1 Tax=Actinocorallia longicatena TaxID=111803 RepID=A0ABP6QJS7_9ACTN